MTAEHVLDAQTKDAQLQKRRNLFRRFSSFIHVYSSFLIRVPYVALLLRWWSASASARAK